MNLPIMMIDMRPVIYVVGLLVLAFGVFMIFPLLTDYGFGNENWRAFMGASILTVFVGGAAALATANGRSSGLNVRQAFLITVFSWVMLPLFGALPLYFGAPNLNLTDAMYESVSAITTTGGTVIYKIEQLPEGAKLWRAILQWLGGLGIVIVAMLFLPIMRVGGMQFFRSEGFDTMGKVMPRALDISAALLWVYVTLTVSCFVVYFALGMGALDAICYAFSSVSTGGFSTSDASFAAFSGALQYACVIFMLLASLPFIRFVQLGQGSLGPLWKDPQVRAYLRWTLYATVAVFLYQIPRRPDVGLEVLFRETLFNVVSVFSGTGFASADVTTWGAFPLVVLILVGIIGGCTSSTGCSIKVFRFLILFEAIKVHVLRLRNPSVVTALHYGGRRVEQDIVDSVIAFFTLFMLSFGVLIVALGLTGLEFRTAITAAWTSICNVGPTYGAGVGPSGAIDGFPDSAKWLMTAGMLVGRLEIVSVYVLFLRRFWRD